MSGTIYPVVLTIPEAEPGLTGEEKVARLSRMAREALRLSAERSGAALGEIRKDESDVPRPSNGHCWSLSHKPGCVAAVVSSREAGIDVEEIRPHDRAMFGLVASDDEWELGGDRSWDTFFRYWTAKEAVLKAVGIGIGGLKKCRVVSIPDGDHIVLDYRGRLFRVAQLRHGEHIVSVVEGHSRVEWVVAEHEAGCQRAGRAHV